MKRLSLTLQILSIVTTKAWMLMPLGWPLLAWHAYRNRNEIRALFQRTKAFVKAQPVTEFIPRDDREGILPPPGSNRRGH
jgi:hypothetical protein